MFLGNQGLVTQVNIKSSGNVVISEALIDAAKMTGIRTRKITPYFFKNSFALSLEIPMLDMFIDSSSFDKL